MSRHRLTCSNYFYVFRRKWYNWFSSSCCQLLIIIKGEDWVRLKDSTKFLLKQEMQFFWKKASGMK